MKYSDGNDFYISGDEGVHFRKVNGEIINNGNKLVLRCNIGGEITAVNIFKTGDSVIIFDQVSYARLVKKT